MRNWKRRYYQITKDGKIIYRETKETEEVLGVFDISGRLEVSRDERSSAEGQIGLSIFSTSTAKRLNIRLIDFIAYKKFCIAIAQACLYHNLLVGFHIELSLVTRLNVCYIYICLCVYVIVRL